MTVTINYLCDLTGFDRRTIQKRLSSLPQPANNQFDAPTALKLIYRPDSLDATHERAALDRVRRELAEIQKAERLGELIPAEVVKERWVSVAANTRAKLLTLPGRLAAVLVGSDQSHATIEREARKIVHEVLVELVSGRARDGD